MRSCRPIRVLLAVVLGGAFLLIGGAELGAAQQVPSVRTATGAVPADLTWGP
jgi:hypothetical protein